MARRLCWRLLPVTPRILKYIALASQCATPWWKTFSSFAKNPSGRKDLIRSHLRDVAGQSRGTGALAGGLFSILLTHTPESALHPSRANEARSGVPGLCHMLPVAPPRDQIL